jgi:broad specificity phosphatase PhoE
MRTLEALAKRLKRALRRVADHHAASCIFVSHGLAGRTPRALHPGLGNAEALRADAPYCHRLVIAHIDPSTEPKHHHEPGWPTQTPRNYRCAMRVTTLRGLPT